MSMDNFKNILTDSSKKEGPHNNPKILDQNRKNTDESGQSTNKKKDNGDLTSLHDTNSPESILRKYLFGNEDANKSAWYGSSLNQCSQEMKADIENMRGLESNMSVHNEDKLTRKGLLFILEDIFDSSQYEKVEHLGEPGLKQWLIHHRINQIDSQHIKKFLLKRAATLNAQSLYKLITRFEEFQKYVSIKAKKKPKDLQREDFLDESLYHAFITNEDYFRNFRYFFKSINPFTEASFTFTPTSRETLNHPTVHAFLNYKRRQGTKADRLKKYKYEMNRFLKWACHVLRDLEGYNKDNVPFSLLQNEHLKSYRKYLVKGIQSGRLSEYNSTKHLRNIKTVFRTLYQMQFLEKDITRGVRNIQSDEFHPRYVPTDQEIEQFFITVERYSDNPVMDKLAFGLMLYLGFRSCELAKLKWENINIGVKDVKFRAKGGKIHALPLPSTVISLLKDIENCILQ